MKHKKFNPGSVYVPKEINKIYIEYFSGLGILEQLNATRFTEKLLHVLPNLCSKIINKQSVVLFSDTVSTLVKDYIESWDNFLLHYKRLYLLYKNNFLS